ncbi:ComEC family competence protein [Flavobacteriales bacterium]|nr:ComEC family competence protein [Flavobacteriales bacterium]
MLRLILPFLVGVITASFLPEFIKVDFQLLVILTTIVGLAILIGMLLTLNLRRSYGFGLFLWPSFIILGSVLSLSVSDSVFPDYLKQEELGGIEKSYVAIIVAQPQIKSKSIKIFAKVTDANQSMNGKVLLYFKKDSTSKQLKYGEQLLLRTKLEKVKGMGNPNEFNYTRYLRFHNISFRGYVNSESWQRLSMSNPSVKGWFLSIRSKLIKKLKEAKLSGNELTVASALILGYRSDLDKELMTAYAGSGATHVLAVSGLHVGIVYVILNSLLKFLNRYRYGRIIRTMILVLLLFSYAALTGLSASVFRAATMFSFVAIGSALNRNTNIFNTLAASAFCLILYEPMIIMQVGFQLSYTAVIGIVLIQPRLFKLYTFKNQLLDWAWSITCVSVAAQIATFPLGLLYFHQFPNLFLISNLLVIPAAASILYLGFSLFIFSYWKPVLLYFGFLLKTLISSLNQVVVWIEKVPYAVLEGIDISTLESLIIYLIIAGILVFIIQENRKGLYASLTLACVFMILQIEEVYTQRNQRFITLYNVKGETAVALVNGTEVTFLSSQKLWENEQSMLFHVRYHWWNKGVETERFVELNDSTLDRVIDWSGTRFSVLNLIDKRQKALGEKTNLLNFLVANEDYISRKTELEKISKCLYLVSEKKGVHDNQTEKPSNFHSLSSIGHVNISIYDFSCSHCKID